MKRKFLCLLLALTMVLGLAATVSAGEDRITSGDWSYRISEGKAILCAYLGSDAEVVVPAKIDGYAVSEVGPNFFCAFGGVAETMTSVTFSEGIERINTNAFKDCTALQKAVIPGSVRTIANSAFEGCTSLTEVELGEGVKSIQRYAFLNTGLTSIFIPASVTTIDEDSIGYTGEWGNTEQIDGFIILGYGDTAAEDYAQSWHFTFYDVTGATENSGACGEGCTWRFEESTGTLYIDADPEADEASTYDYINNLQPWVLHAEKITRMVVGEGVRALGDNTMAFHYTNLREVILPESLGEIGNNAFNGCIGLKQIDLPEDLHYILFQAFANCGLTSVDLPDALCYIGDSAFRGCAELTRVKLPSALTDLGSHAFADCVKLSSVEMPESHIDSIGDGVFLNCTALTDISFYNDNTIGWYMFQNCDGLTTVAIREGTWEIGNGAFAYCDNLTHVTIPDGVYSMGQRIFNQCGKLGTVLFLGDAPNLNQLTFEGVTTTCYYPAGNETWTYYPQSQLGGNITWVAYDPDLFLDVPVDSFYYEPVVWAFENGITTGISDIEFGPEGQCQRGQIVTFLWRAAGCPVVEAENPFTDVKETDFYYNAVLWAVENGITTGTSADTFSPYKACTRAEVVTFLWRAHGSLVVETAEQYFADVDGDDFFYHAVQWAYAAGITNGIDEAHFGPYAICNRAQVVTFLYRAKDFPKYEPSEKYTFELRSNDPTEETGFVFCEGTEFTAGESVIFYAEPWYGYLAEFAAEPDVELELYYLGACTYELVMPAHDVVLTANFVPAPGEAHFINTTCANGEFFALCDFDEDLRDFAKAGEFVQFYVMPDEGFTLTPENITLTVGGESWEDWWFLGELVEEIPEEDLVIDGIFLFEAVMPEGDLEVSITCTPGTEAASAQVRVPVSLN